MPNIPLAASPTSPTPGLYLTVDLTPRSVSPGSQPIRGCILAPKNSTGDITNNTEIRPVLSLEDVETSHGQGSLASLTYASMKRKYPSLQVDVVSPAPSAGAAATGSVQVAGTITADYTGRVKISGRVIDVPWLVGETAADWHAKAVTYVGRYVRDLFCTPSVGTSPDRLLLTANSAGPAGNDITLSFELLDGAGASAPTVTAFNGGTTEPDFTTALDTIKGVEYDFIGLALSNADAVSTTGNVALLEAHLNAYASGPASKLQQGVVGHTGLRTGATASAIARNSQVIELFNLQNAMALPCEVIGDEMGDRMQQVVLAISKNRIGRSMAVYPSADPAGDHPTPAQSDAALLAGLSIGGYDQSGSPYVIRAITTYSQTTTGAQVLPTDCNEIDAIYQYAKDLRAALSVEFAGVKVARDAAEPDEDGLPNGVVEERDIRAFIVSRTRSFWIPKGVLDRASFEDSVTSGTLVVSVNDTDETQVDIFIPLKASKNLAKLGVYAAKEG